MRLHLSTLREENLLLKETSGIKKLEAWKQLKTDEGAVFDKEYTFDASDIEPMITYGTNPGMGVGVSGFYSFC